MSQSTSARWAATAGLSAILGLAAVAARGDDAPDAEAVVARLQALDVKGAEELLGRLKSDAKTPASKDAVKALDKELEAAKKLAPIAKKMEKLYSDKKMRECYSAFMGGVDACPGALALRGVLKDNGLEARQQAYLVLEDFEGEPAPAKDAPAKDAPGDGAAPTPAPAAGGDDKPAPEPSKSPEPQKKAKPKKPTIAWTAHACSGDLVPDAAGGWALRWTVEAGKKRAFWDRKLKDPIDLGDYDLVSIRLRASAAVKGSLTLGFSQGKGSYVEAVLKVEPDGKWHEQHFTIADLPRTGIVDAANITHAVLHHVGNDSVDVTVDEILLAKKK